MNESRSSKLFKGISIQTVTTIIMGILEILYFSVMSRLLSKVDFGYFAAISGVMAVCMSLSEAGLGAAIIQKKDASQAHISTSFTLSLILGLTFSFVVFVIAPWIAEIVADETLAIPLQLMSSIIFLHSLVSVGNAILYKSLNFKRIGFNSILAYTISCFIGIIMAHNGLGLYAIISANILNSILLVVLLYGFSVKIPRIKIFKNETKSIISFGGWLTIGVILNNISHQLDKLVLSKWLSVETLGAYNRPAGFVSTISSKINGIFDSVLFPILSELQNEQDLVTSIFFRAISILNSLSIILASIFFFNAELIITVFFGPDWLDVIPVMQIASLGVIFNIDGRLVDSFFRSLNYVKLGTQLRVVGVILMLLSIYIGSQYGIIGVAWSIMLANVTLVIIKMVFLAVKVNASVVKMFIVWVKAWKSAIIPSIIGIIYLHFPHSITINIIFAVLYGGIILGEFAFFPQILGKEYEVSVYPMIKKIKNKILNKL